jgi:hypothetical protein
MSPGAYVEQVNSSRTVTDPMIIVHGSGATLSMPTGNDGATVVAARVTFINMSIVNAFGDVMRLTSGALRHVHVSGYSGGVKANADVTLADVEVSGLGGGDAVGTYGSAMLTLDRVIIDGKWARGIAAENFGAIVQVTNALVYDTADLAIDLSMADGATLAFITVADSGADTGTGPRAVACSSNVTVRNSIIWAPGATTRVAIQGCNISNSIVGPDPISGVSNADPQFANAVGHDYHLSANSPAIDKATTGPMLDFEGDVRPKGSAYDLGADEAR